MTLRRGIRTLAAAAMAVASIGVFIVVPLAAPQPDIVYAFLVGTATTSFVLVGLLLVGRASGNRIGWLLVLSGILLAVAYGIEAYGLAGAAGTPPWPGSALAFVLSDSIFVSPLVIAFVGIPLVFPNGRLVSPRWRWLVWLAVVATAAQAISVILAPGGVGPTNLPNPLGVRSLGGIASILGALSSASSVLGFGGAAAAVWVRYRRGDPVERQQLKWLLAVTALATMFFPASFIIPDSTIAGVFFILGSLTLSALPVAIAVAVLRYRLYEIDRIISRTIAYGLITALLVMVFLVVNLGLQALLSSVTSANSLSVAGSTLLAAALFTPVRRGVQRIVDRRFDRARYDGERTASAFSVRMRDATDLPTVAADLDGTVRRAIAPSRVGLWLRGSDR